MISNKLDKTNNIFCKKHIIKKTHHQKSTSSKKHIVKKAHHKKKYPLAKPNQAQPSPTKPNLSNLPNLPSSSIIPFLLSKGLQNFPGLDLFIDSSSTMTSFFKFAKLDKSKNIFKSLTIHLISTINSVVSFSIIKFKLSN